MRKPHVQRTYKRVLYEGTQLEDLVGKIVCRGELAKALGLSSSGLSNRLRQNGARYKKILTDEDLRKPGVAPERKPEVPAIALEWNSRPLLVRSA